MLARIFVFLLKPIALISVQNLRSGKLSLAAEPRKVGIVAISQQTGILLQLADLYSAQCAICVSTPVRPKAPAKPKLLVRETI